VTNITLRSEKGSAFTNNEVDSSFNALNVFKVELTDSAGSIIVPAGTTAQRDTSPAAGYLRYNTSDSQLEHYNGSAWAAVGFTSTSDISEGTNLYYTAARGDSAARSALVGGTGLTYDSATGIFDITNSGVSAASYGGAEAIPVITVNAQGQITSATTAALSTATTAAIIVGGDGKFAVDGVSQQQMSLEPGNFRFDQSHSSNNNHPIRFSTTSNGTHGGGSNYTTGVTYVGTPGNAGAYTQFVVTQSTPQVMYYFCANHSAMGAGVAIGNYTPTQIDSDARLAISVTDAGGDGSASYNSGTGVITYTGPSAAQVRAHFSGGTGITISSGSITTTDGDIVHDNTSGFVANEHIDHTGVSITAGAGLTGGGTIAATRDIAIGAGTGVTVNANDIAIGQSVATNANVTFNTVALAANPTAALGAATKQYVDTIAAAGIHYHDPARVMTTGNLSAGYANGSSGVGATLTNNTTQAALSIDGVALSTNDRVVVQSQSAGAQNGVYKVTTVGSGSANWVLTRTTDTDSYAASDPDAFGTGDAFFILEGSANAGNLEVMNTSGTITFGTTAITFTNVAKTAVYTAKNGVALDGTAFSIDSGANIIAATFQSNTLKFPDSDASHFVSLKSPHSPFTSNLSFFLPPADGTSGQALVTDGAGHLGFAAAGATITSDTSTNTDFKLYFAATTSGALTAVKQDSGLKYNPSTGTITSDEFIGNVTGTLDGILGGATPAAATATTIVANTSVQTDTVKFPDSDASHFVTIASPHSPFDSDLTFTLPPTDGTAGQAMVTDGAGHLGFAAAGATITGDTSTNTDFRLYFAATTSGALTAVKTDSGLLYNPSTGKITTDTFQGNVIGNVTGNVTGNTSGTAGSATGNAATATILQNARTIGGVSFNGSAAIDLPGVNAAGNQNTSGLAATATILATTRAIGGVNFNGSAAIDLPGVNTAGNQATSGLAATATLSATVTATANNTADETVYPTFVDGATGAQGIETDTGLTYNPNSGTLTSTVFSGGLSGNATTATTLATTRAINGVNFNGSAAITVTAAAGTLSGSTLKSSVTGSSLTSVGTIGTGTWQGTAIATAYTVAKVTSVNSVTGAVTAAHLLTAIKTVDGAGSGLDADLLDGQSSAHYRINVYNASGTLLN